MSSVSIFANGASAKSCAERKQGYCDKFERIWHSAERRPQNDIRNGNQDQSACKLRNSIHCPAADERRNDHEYVNDRGRQNDQERAASVRQPLH